MTLATTSTRPKLDASKYQSLPKIITTGDSDTFHQIWDEGVDESEDKPTTAAEMRQDEKIQLLDQVIETSDSSLIELDDHQAASESVRQMSHPANKPTKEFSSFGLNIDPREISLERTHLSCCAVASISLLCLSIASFVMPGISTYPPEHSTVQALGYSAGVVSLLSSMASGAFVVYSYAKSGTEYIRI